MIYSKYEATTYGRDVAFVFALDKTSVLQLVQQQVTHAPVAPEELERHRDFFSRWVFDRFTVQNDGATCTHPPSLGRFFWDAPTMRVLAVTRFQCRAPLHELVIRSSVTHDMPTSHEMVGDLQHGRALIRSYFASEWAEARIVVDQLPPSRTLGPPPRARGRIASVPMPDRQRRYERLAAAELGVKSLDVGVEDRGRPWSTLPHFIGQGVLHIFTGYDHVLFILTLMLAVATWRRLAVIVTSFTAAHSLTLIASTLGLVRLPSRVVEPLIALSVLLVAVDALARPQANARAAVTFAFGLLHGFGLSSVLRELGLTSQQLAPALLGFNLGVEIGQLAIVAPLFPLVLWLRKQPTLYPRARVVLCSSVAVLAVVWIVLRVREAISA
jgi:hydrogenase/urease accessory protein HupE